MKKLVAVLMALMMVFAAVALAEESVAWDLGNGIQFNMDLEQVQALANRPNPEIENEKTRGPVEFTELEYDNVPGADGITGDVKFLFVGNSLVAIHYDCADGVSYDTVKAQVTKLYGEAVPFDAAKIGNGKYAIDDDGDLKDCKEMIEAEGLLVVLEQDKDGDVDLTLLDPTAAYINN